jgi:hypothetical protein
LKHLILIPDIKFCPFEYGQIKADFVKLEEEHKKLIKKNQIIKDKLDFLADGIIKRRKNADKDQRKKAKIIARKNVQIRRLNKVLAKTFINSYY